MTAKLRPRFPPHSRWVVFSSQSQYPAASLIHFSINLPMNFNQNAAVKEEKEEEGGRVEFF